MSEPASEPPARRLQPVLLVLGAMFAFSLMAVFTRGAGASFLGISAWRAVVVAVVFAAAAAITEGPLRALRTQPRTLRLGAVLGVALAVASSTFVGGYAFTTVANTIFLHNLAPVVVFPLAWWLSRERPAPEALAGAGLALVGVGMLTGVSLFQFAHFANPRFLLGDALSLASAVGYGAVLVLTRVTRREETPLLGTLAVAWAVAAVVLVAVALGAGELAVSWGAAPWILGLAIVSTVVPFTLLNLGMRSVPAGTASVLSLSEVVFATTLGALVYGERLAPIGWIGGGLAALGVLYAIRPPGGGVVVEGVDRLDPGTVGARGARLGLALALLNAGTLTALLTGDAAAPLLAWAGLAMLARLGPPVGAALLEGQLSRALGWAGAVAAAAALAGVVVRGGWDATGGSPVVLVLAGAAVALDGALAAREAEGDRDGLPMLRAALVALAAGEALGWLGHGGGRLLVMAAAVGVGVTALGVALSGLRLRGAALPVHRQPEAARFDRLVEPLRSRGRLAVIAAVVVLAGGVRVVPTGSVGIVERFGRPLDALAPSGLAIRLPPPIERLTIVDVSSARRLPFLDVASPLLVGDQSMVSLRAVLHYRVADPAAYAYGVADPDAALMALARAALVEVVARRSQDEVLTTGRGEVEQQMLARAQAGADQAGLGVEILSAHLASAAVPAPVVSAFLDVISADEERETRINEAEAYAADQLPRARGAALETLSVAEGDAAMVAAKTDGERSMFDAIRQGGAASPRMTRARLGYETVERALDDARVVLVPPGVTVLTGGAPAPVVVSEAKK